jgi:hypothetical protein
MQYNDENTDTIAAVKIALQNFDDGMNEAKNCMLNLTTQSTKPKLNCGDFI